MSETALTAGDLETKILRQLKETTEGIPGTDRSEAFKTALIFDTMNEIYELTFNNPRKQVKIRNEDLNFDTIIDTKLTSQVDIGDTSIVVGDSSTYPATGRILIENEFIDYTANDLVTTFTVGASEIQATHINGKTVRPAYALPSDIDKEKAQYVNVRGLPYYVKDIAEMLDQYKSNYRNFAIHDGFLILPENLSVLSVLFTYTPAIIRKTLAADIFSLIPNNFRVALIVNGSVGKLMMLDGQRGYERYYRPPESRRDKGGGLFYSSLWEFYANYGRQTDIRDKRTSRSVYDDNFSQ